MRLLVSVVSPTLQLGFLHIFSIVELIIFLSYLFESLPHLYEWCLFPTTEHPYGNWCHLLFNINGEI